MNSKLSRLSIILIIVSISFFINMICYADQPNDREVTYTINYAPNSKIKSPSLKNTTAKIQLYLGGNSIERLTIRTDQNQSFSITNRHAKQHGGLLVVAVHSIEGEQKDISCYGASLPGKTNIIVDCHTRSEKKHYH